MGLASKRALEDRKTKTASMVCAGLIAA